MITGEVMGVFDGTIFVGDDGRLLVVPGNYVSKSKLLEGSIVRAKLVNGKAEFKIVQPAERRYVIVEATRGPSMRYVYKEAGSMRTWKTFRECEVYFQVKEGKRYSMEVPVTSTKGVGVITNEVD
jgi:hypothetical protein